MKKIECGIFVSLLILAVALTLILVRNLPFSQVPIFGNEEQYFTIPGLANQKEHRLGHIFDRVREVHLRNDRDGSRNRVLQASEWSYNRSTGILRTTVREEPMDERRLYLDISHFVVYGVVRKPWRLNLIGFTGSVEDVFVYISGRGRALPGRDFRLDTKNGILNLSRDISSGPMFISYWNSTKQNFFEWVYGGPEYSYVGEFKKDNASLSAELISFHKDFQKKNPPEAYFVIENPESEDAQVVLRKDVAKPNLVEGQYLEWKDIRNIPPDPDGRISEDLGFIVQVPEFLSGYKLTSRTLTETRYGEKLYQGANFDYVKDKTRIRVFSSPQWLVQKWQRIPKLSSRTVKLGGVKVDVIEYWNTFDFPSYEKPQLNRITLYYWMEDGNTWSAETHEALLNPPLDLEAFIEVFIEARVGLAGN